MSRAITLPEPSHIPFRGDSLNSRGSGDSSLHSPPPRHPMHSCTLPGQRRVTQYLRMATASWAKARPVASVASRSADTTSDLQSLMPTQYLVFRFTQEKHTINTP